MLHWIDSGAELCRFKKPARPPKHLISYFALVDDEHILLVEQINAELWLPPGGGVDPGEPPRDTARREAKEELTIEADFLTDGPVFLSITETVGKTAAHTDVSLWTCFAVRSTRTTSSTTRSSTQFAGSTKTMCRSTVPIQSPRISAKTLPAIDTIADTLTSQREWKRTKVLIRPHSEFSPRKVYDALTPIRFHQKTKRWCRVINMIVVLLAVALITVLILVMS